MYLFVVQSPQLLTKRLIAMCAAPWACPLLPKHPMSWLWHACEEERCNWEGPPTAVMGQEPWEKLAQAPELLWLLPAGCGYCLPVNLGASTIQIKSKIGLESKKKLGRRGKTLFSLQIFQGTLQKHLSREPITQGVWHSWDREVVALLFSHICVVDSFC